MKRLLSSLLLTFVLATTAHAQVSFNLDEYLFDPSVFHVPYKVLGTWICPPVPAARFTEAWCGAYVGGELPGQGPQTTGACLYGFATDPIVDFAPTKYFHGGGAICPPDQAAFCESIGTLGTRPQGGGGADWGTNCLPWPPE